MEINKIKISLYETVLQWFRLSSSWIGDFHKVCFLYCTARSSWFRDYELGLLPGGFCAVAGNHTVLCAVSHHQQKQCYLRRGEIPYQSVIFRSVSTFQ